VCDLETSSIGAPYIYDIRSLRVNDLTLILLTWRKWGDSNSSKKQMGFNSAFKGLNNMEKYGRARQATDGNITQHMRIACWVSEVTNTHSDYAIPIAFSLHQWLHERTLVITFICTPPVV
jgi:hypothetical protein